MLQPLDYLLQTFTPQNDAEFRQWLKKNGKGPAELRLFIALRRHGHKGRAAVMRWAFDKKPTDAAYSSARRRLHTKVSEYIVSVLNEHDASQISHVVNYIMLALHCLAHNKDEAVLDFLKRAEKLSRLNKQLSLLDEVLYLRIKHAERLNVNVTEAVAKWEENNKELMEYRRIEIAFAEIRAELMSAKKAGKVMDVDRVVNDAFNRFQITVQQANDPELIIKLVGIGRAAYISIKEYRKIEPFIERFYFRFKKNNAFGPGMVECEMQYVQLLAHTYYRNRKFDKAERMLKAMEEPMNKHSVLKKRFQPRWLAMKAGVRCYTGHIDEAIQIAQKALRSEIVRGEQEEQINLQLNLAVYYFNAAMYKEAMKMIRSLPKDDELLKRKGQEWTMKKQMIEMIILYEKGDDDIAMQVLQRILSSYEELWQRPLFSVSFAFLKFAKRIFTNANVVSDTKFRTELNKVRMSGNEQQPDIHVISFYCWLKSKVFGGDYYTLLVERIGR